jgi:plastocyanin
VITYATKVLTALAVAAFIAAAVFYGVVGDRLGALLLLFLGTSATLAAVVVIASGERDIAPYVPADAPPPERNATTPGAAATPSVWPVLTAAAVMVLAVGFATNRAVVMAGAIAVGLCAIGWFAKSWTDHPTWTPRVSERVSDRFVAPFGLPLLGFGLAAVIAISLSRVFLAVSLEAAPWIALAISIAILGVCAWLATRPRVASSLVMALAAVAAASMVGAGIAGAAQGEREFHHADHAVEHAHLEVTAKQTDFVEKELTAPANEDVVMEFHNLDPDIFHNVALYQSDAADAPPIFNGQGFPGVRSMDYEFKTPAPGRYPYRCDFHANMVGTLVVGGS